MSYHGLSEQSVLDKLLGGYLNSFTSKKVTFYHLISNEIIAIKGSKLYDDGISYWFGITPSALKKCSSNNVTHYIFILGYEGVIKLPINILHRYIEHADKSLKPDGTVKHYHVRIRFDDDKLNLYNKTEHFDMDPYYIYFEEKVEEAINKDFVGKSKEELLHEALNFNGYEKQYTVSEGKTKRRKESKAQKERIAFLEDHKCQVCGFYEEYINSKGEKAWIIEIDHIIPKSIGGNETVNNLWALCPNCHAKKGKEIIKVDIQSRVVTERGNAVQIRDNHLWNISNKNGSE